MIYKILVADDDFDNRTIAAESLESLGYRVLQATNGLETIAAAGRETPDLILLDLSMPKLDGWETVKRLKALPQTAKIPVIAFTAHAMIGDEKKAKAAGCDDYLTKPCPPKKIAEKAGEWLRKIDQKINQRANHENFND